MLTADAELHDISIEGLKVATDLALATGDAVVVRLPNRTAVQATVRWTRDGFVGLRFAAALSEVQVDEIAGSAAAATEV